MSSRVCRELSLIFLTALGVQLICRYFPHVWLWHDHFYGLRFSLRLLAPLVLAFALGWSASDLGLSRPRLDRGSLLLILACIALMGMIPVIRLAPEYLARYAAWRSASAPLAIRLEQFALFTISSLLGWEFLHRGFLLFGLRRSCALGGIPEDLSRLLAICITATFEVLFHLTKPGWEAAGMLLASPLLSIVAFRTGSLWVPLVLHLMIEALFFLVISM